MDKIAANNHFVVLRKEIKKAKAMVCGNLIRKITNLKEEKEKLEDDEIKMKKLDAKIEGTYEETKLLKTLDTYEIAKQATLRPDPNHWERMIGDSKASAESRLIARVISKNNVLKQVNKFRSDHVDCDEWLNEYIEYREKKKEIKECAGMLRKQPKRQNNNKSQNSTHHTRGTPFRKKTDKRVNSTRPNTNYRVEKTIIPDETQAKANVGTETLHPSWASKRKEKDILKAALNGGIEGSHRIKFDNH